VDDEQRLPPDVRGVIDRMSDGDWESLTLQLGRHAVRKSRRFFWHTGTAGELPYGEVAESIVSKALVLWLSGRRRWNRAEYADLQSFLAGVVDSLLSHSANGHDNRRAEFDAGIMPAQTATPESELLAKERAAAAERDLAAITAQSRTDAVAGAIVDAMRGGAETRRDIIAATGRTAADIDNGLKRLRRMAASVARSRTHGS